MTRPNIYYGRHLRTNINLHANNRRWQKFRHSEGVLYRFFTVTLRSFKRDGKLCSLSNFPLMARTLCRLLLLFRDY